MTVQEKAYFLINKLPDDCIEAIIQVMLRMLPNVETNSMPDSKMRAFLKMQEMRKESLKYDIQDFDVEREEAMRMKYDLL